MPLKLNVGVSRKLGLPNYGSVGASCAVEVELEPLAFHDTDRLRGQCQEAFATCRQAVEEELGKQQIGAHAPTVDGEDSATHGDPQHGNARSGNSIVPLATTRQIDFAYHLAREIRALVGQRLSVLVEQLYDRKIEELTSPEASRLIDLLKELRAGTKSVDDVLTGAAA